MRGGQRGRWAKESEETEPRPHFPTAGPSFRGAGASWRDGGRSLRDVRLKCRCRLNFFSPSKLTQFTAMEQTDRIQRWQGRGKRPAETMLAAA